MKSNYEKLIKFYGSDKIKILERNVFDQVHLRLNMH